MAGTPPGKTFTPGLDFSGQSYVDWNNKANEDVDRAYAIIKEKLPLMGKMNGVISLTLGDRQPVFIDARSGEAKLINEFDGEPTTTLNMKAECKIQLAATHTSVNGQDD